MRRKRIQVRTIRTRLHSAIRFIASLPSLTHLLYRLAHSIIVLTLILTTHCTIHKYEGRKTKIQDNHAARQHKRNTNTHHHTAPTIGDTKKKKKKMAPPARTLSDAVTRVLHARQTTVTVTAAASLSSSDYSSSGPNLSGGCDCGYCDWVDCWGFLVVYVCYYYFPFGLSLVFFFYNLCMVFVEVVPPTCL